jgi:hypothetical protein
MSVDPANSALLAAAVLNAAAAFLHLCVICKGPPWYRLFGAGERYARAAEQGLWWPHIHTAGIAGVLGLWSLYALSGAQLLPTLPALKPMLLLITAVYLFRGVVGLVFALRPPSLTRKFWFLSSLVCLCLGMVHAVGLWQIWERP